MLFKFAYSPGGDPCWAGGLYSGVTVFGGCERGRCCSGVFAV